MGVYKKRKSHLYDPKSKEPFRVSRSKIDMFLECPRCFYLDRRLGLGRPSMPAWTLNSAVDQLLKNEFDLLRKNGESHKLMKKYGIDAVPFKHPDLSVWRDDHYRYRGACVTDKETNLQICGIVDDIWVSTKTDELFIVDYKSTSTSKKISLDSKYKQRYKKQMEVYQWIFKKKGFEVAKTGYFLFANAGRNRPKFDGRLEFETLIIPHEGDVSWVNPTISEIKECLESDRIPAPGDECEHCAYRQLANKEIKKKKQGQNRKLL